RRHTRFSRDWSSDVCSYDLEAAADSVASHRAVAPGGQRQPVQEVPSSTNRLFEAPPTKSPRRDLLGGGFCVAPGRNGRPRRGWALSGAGGVPADRAPSGWGFTHVVGGVVTRT